MDRGLAGARTSQLITDHARTPRSRRRSNRGIAATRPISRRANRAAQLWVT
jgi:hypothetical protein